MVPRGRGLLCRDRGAAKRVEGQRKGKRKRGERKRRVVVIPSPPPIYTENDVTPVRVGTEPSGLWD